MRRKAAGKPIKAAEREEKPDNVINLMDALKQSLKGKAAAKRRRMPRPRAGRRNAARPRRRTARRRGRARRGNYVAAPQTPSLPELDPGIHVIALA